MSTHNIKKFRKHGDSKTKILSGTTISPGYAKGIMHIYRGILGPEDSPSKSHKYNADEEIARLDQATFDISNELMELANLVEKEIDARLAEVFDAHKMILNDSLLRSELRKEIVENFVSASIAVKSVFLRWEKRFLLMESIVAKEKADDMRDISIRLCNALAGITIHPLEKIPKNCVLVTTRLLPSDTIFLKRQSVAAVLLEYGSFGSHAALFARQMGLPCISDVPNIMNLLKNEDKALVDANKGVVTLNPTKTMEKEFDKNWSDYLRMFKH